MRKKRQTRRRVSPRSAPTAPMRRGTVYAAEEKDGPETTLGVEDHTHGLRTDRTVVC